LVVDAEHPPFIANGRLTFWVDSQRHEVDLATGQMLSSP
jgi:hypothetical protein